MLVEVWGPSGAGKSTILRELNKAASEDAVSRWVFPRELDEIFDVVPRTKRVGSMDVPELARVMECVFSGLASSEMRPSQRVRALQIFARSAFRKNALAGSNIGRPVIHDELLLNRAFSMLAHAVDHLSLAWDYFSLVPAPSAAVLVTASEEVLREHLAARQRVVNVYGGVESDVPAMSRLLEQLIEIAEVGTRVLQERGVPLIVLNGAESPETNARRLRSWMQQLSVSEETQGDDLRERLLEAAESFKKGAGRHQRRNASVAYASFITSHFSVLPGEAQRNTAVRIEQFGLGRQDLQGRTVLDLGCNTGAMLFQLSNLGIRRGLGIEYDVDKVQIAREIASRSDLDELAFLPANLDTVESEFLGVHDFVMCLAVEGHVEDRKRLFDLLGRVTGRELCFEGNSGCDVQEVMEQLRAAGFDEVWQVGTSTDDIDPRNHRRPVLRACKLSS